MDGTGWKRRGAGQSQYGGEDWHTRHGSTQLECESIPRKIVGGQFTNAEDSSKKAVENDVEDDFHRALNPLDPVTLNTRLTRFNKLREAFPT